MGTENLSKLIIPIERIEHKIYLIRGQKVILDRDLAELYGVETRVLNQAVRRNQDRFPGDFLLSLSREEIRDLSQIVISSKMKHAPNVFAFTEQGVAMLSGVLHSKRAVQMNIVIMRAFVKLRQIISSNKELAEKFGELEKRIQKHDVEIYSIFKAIRQLMVEPEKPKKRIGFVTEDVGRGRGDEKSPPYKKNRLQFPT